MFAKRTGWRLEPNRFALALEEHRRRGEPLIDLTISNPTVCGIAYPEAQIVAALSHPQMLRYEPESKGLRQAREAIADYYAGRPRFPGAEARIDPERIFITSGTSEAYSHAFRLLCDAGDEVLVPAPSYPLFDYLADLADVRAVPYRLFYDQGWQMDFAELDQVLTSRSKAVIVVHPNNPTGSFVRREEALRLAELCARRAMAVIADEVFLDYAEGAEPQPTFASPSSALTFTLSGLSKICLLPQMKVGWIVVSGPDNLSTTAAQRLEVIADTYLSPSVPSQLAVADRLGVRDDLQTQVRRRVRANLAFLDGLLSPSGAVTRLRREGGWYAVLRVPAKGSDEELAISLLEDCNVFVHPGHFFDFAGDGFLILSLIGRESEFQEGVRRLLDFLKRR